MRHTFLPSEGGASGLLSRNLQNEIWFSSSFWAVGLRTANKPKKYQKKILNGLAQDSSHRIDFFYFDINLGILAMKKKKIYIYIYIYSRKISKRRLHAKTQRSQRPFLFMMQLNYDEICISSEVGVTCLPVSFVIPYFFCGRDILPF